MLEDKQDEKKTTSILKHVLVVDIFMGKKIAKVQFGDECLVIVNYGLMSNDPCKKYANA